MICNTVLLSALGCSSSGFVGLWIFLSCFTRHLRASKPWAASKSTPRNAFGLLSYGSVSFSKVLP